MRIDTRSICQQINENSHTSGESVLDREGSNSLKKLFIWSTSIEVYSTELGADSCQ